MSVLDELMKLRIMVNGVEITRTKVNFISDTITVTDDPDNAATDIELEESP